MISFDRWNITTESEFEDVKNGNCAEYFGEDFNGIISVDTRYRPNNFQIEPEDIGIIASKAADGLEKFNRIVVMDIHENVVMFSKNRNVAIINMTTTNGLGGNENRVAYLPYGALF